MHKRPDISKAKSEFGHDPQTTLEAGVPKTLGWMRDLYPGRAPQVQIV